MRAPTFVSGLVVAIALAFTAGSVPAFGQSATPRDAKATPSKTVLASVSFATLSGVKAVPMAPRELKAVKGMHVHFRDAGGGKIHLAGDIKTQNNWANLGGSDGLPVAPSYHGLCVAIGGGGITIPGSVVQC